MSLLLRNAAGKILYCVVSRRVIKDRTTKEIVEIKSTDVYVHAHSAGEARWIFCQDSQYKKYNIVAVAPAIGFHVEDNHGEVLTA